MIVYLAHPVRGDVWGNLQKAKAWYRWILRTFPDVAVIADWIISCEVLDDPNAADRQRGMHANEILLPRADEVWAAFPWLGPSAGMRTEMGLAQQLRIPVRRLPVWQEPDGPPTAYSGVLVRLLPCDHVIEEGAEFCADCVVAGRSLETATLDGGEFPAPRWMLQGS